MSAEVLSPDQYQDRVNNTVRRTVAALIEGRGLDKDQVAKAVGMKRATMYRRLGGSGSMQAFGAGEVAALARYFNLPIGSFYDGLGGAFVDTGKGSGTVTRCTDYSPSVATSSVLSGLVGPS